MLELVEGDTLAERLKRGAIPVEESLKLALQIAEALEAAHEKGVIHRDLKPANIKVTPDGKVKVLDFGLAKAFAGDGSEANLSQSPTISMTATQQGVILGTAAYMSPEQARGQEVDKRADVWAFGCVFYEMLTGRQLWGGPTVTDMIAAAVARDADLGALPANIHPAIQELIRRSVEKEPKSRWQAVGDVRVEIEHALADPGGVLIQPVADVIQTPPRPMLGWIAATFVLASMIAVVATWILKPEPRFVGPVTRFDFVPSEIQQLLGFNRSFLAFSPDGRRLAYGARAGLYLRSMDEGVARVVPGTESDAVRSPSFSPEGESIAYFSRSQGQLLQGQLKTIQVEGGIPVVLQDIEAPRGVSWTEDNSILWVQNRRDIMSIPSGGGDPVTLVNSEVDIAAPMMLPGGKSLLYTLDAPNETNRKVAVRSLESAEERPLFTGSAAHYLPTGYLVYGVGTDIHARRFDSETWELGEAVPLVQDVFRGSATAPSQWDVSASGSLAYITGRAQELTGTPVWVTPDGKEQESISTSALAGLGSPKLSPDDGRVALIVGGLSGDVWVHYLDGRPPMRLTFAESNLNQPTWSPEGDSIVYESDTALVAIDTNAPGDVGETVSPPGHFHLVGWSADGTEFVATAIERSATGIDIVRWPVGRPDEIQDVVATAFNEGRGAALSPDGRLLAYTSDETSTSEVWVKSYPAGVATRVSLNGGREPVWARNGRQLYYLEGTRLMAVDIDGTGDGFTWSRADFLFDSAAYSNSGTSTLLQQPSYDVARDGRFLMVKPASQRSPLRVEVVLNWFEELTERVPVP